MQFRESWVPGACTQGQACIRAGLCRREYNLVLAAGGNYLVPQRRVYKGRVDIRHQIIDIRIVRSAGRGHSNCNCRSPIHLKTEHGIARQFSIEWGNIGSYEFGRAECGDLEVVIAFFEQAACICLTIQEAQFGHGRVCRIGNTEG